MHQRVETPWCPKYRGVAMVDLLKIQKSAEKLRLPGVLSTRESRLHGVLSTYWGVALVDMLKIQES